MFVCASLSKLFTSQIGVVPAPTHADKQDSSLGSRNAFLFLSETTIPTRRKSRNIKNVH